MRPVAAESLRRAAALADASLLRLEWRPARPPAPSGPSGPREQRWAWLGAFDAGEALRARGVDCAHHPRLAALLADLDTGGGAPDVVVLAERPDPDAVDLAAAAHAATGRVLTAVQDWLADARLQDSRLAVVTRGAVGAGGAPDPVLAAVWGLVASAQAEHPGRIVLVDHDGLGPSLAALPEAVGGDAPQVALRDGVSLVPRLARVTEPVPSGGPPWRADGTVLVTGGLGTLGRLVVRHLVTAHGVRRLVIVSRSGASGDGAAEFLKELRAEGAALRVVAGDAGDRAVVDEALAAVPDEHPLSAVVHLAGVLDDGVLQAQTPERVDRVLRPKADGAWHLHAATAAREADGADVAFVAFSSVSSVLGPAGQAGYAAANAFVDALMARRRAAGLRGVSLGWGLWAARSGLTGDLDDADVRRMARSGVKPLASDQALALLDLACATGEPVLFPLRLDTASLGGGAAADVPPPLRGLARTPVRRASVDAEQAPDDGSLADRLAGLPEGERDALLLNLVRTHVAAVLGHDDPRTVGERRPFADIGFDSLRALQLRNRLGGATGLRLSPTLVFDHPTPLALAQRLRTLLLPDVPHQAPAGPEPEHRTGDEVRDRLRSASPEEVFDFIDDLLGE
ncbi:type I polyketide synthase [Streptomyces sp. G45]|uniref:type I polyketide synthase n=1 Tax=Streptomyces sp. G45 TaxID=3406627 RepID=UPI003C24BDE4